MPPTTEPSTPERRDPSTQVLVYDCPVVVPQPSTTLLPHNSETPSPVFSDPPQVLPDMNTIVSQWQQLTSMDRQSTGFLPLLSSLTSGTNKVSTTMLQDDDARVTLGAIDEVNLPFVAKAIT